MTSVADFAAAEGPLASFGVADLDRRSDVLVSIVLLAGPDPDELEWAYERAWQFVEERFEFFEILIAAPMAFTASNASLMQRLSLRRNVRRLVMADDVSDHRAAVVAATESIGDVAILWACEEARFVDIAALFEVAERSSGSAVVRRRRVAGGVASVITGRFLSAISGYRIDPRVLRSCAHHRSYLTAVTRRPDSELALRFMREGALERSNKVFFLEIDGSGPRPRFLRRLRLLLQILTSSPARLLRLLSVVSLFTFLSATAFVFYAIILFAIGADLQPGWLTTSLAIGGSTAFASLSIGAISVGIYQLLVSASSDEPGEIVEDINNCDLFAEFDVINIDTRDKG